MNNQTFEKILENRLNECRRTLSKKAGEYASEEDRLHNFKVAARISLEATETPESALWGMLNKHIVSVMDIVRACEFERCAEAVLNEKLGDSINYLILLETLLRERFGYCVDG